MKAEDIKYFFQSLQKRILKELEKKRKIALYANRAVTIGAVILFIGFIVFVGFITYYGKEEFFKKINPFYEKYILPIVEKFESFASAFDFIPLAWLAGILLLIIAVLIFLLYQWIQDRYVREFKNQINKKLFSRLNPQIKYKPDQYISEEDFKKSSIFSDESYNYEGSDYCSLNVKHHLTEFSEIKASVTRSTGKHSSTTEIYFHGLFMKLHIKLSPGFLFIIPKQKEGFFSLIGRKVNSFSGKEKLDLPGDFGQNFDVYCDDVLKAQKILTNDLKSSILKMRSQFNKNIYLSFQDSFIYMAVECGAFFEPPLKKPIQTEHLKQSALLLNSFVSAIASIIPLLNKS